MAGLLLGSPEFQKRYASDGRTGNFRRDLGVEKNLVVARVWRRDAEGDMARRFGTDTTDWGCDMQGRDLARRGLNGGPSRRAFMKGGALALVGTSVIPSVSAAQRDGGSDDGGGEQ